MANIHPLPFDGVHLHEMLTALNDEVAAAGADQPVPWSRLQDVPQTFEPSEHDHAVSEIRELTGILAAKAETSVTDGLAQDIAAISTAVSDVSDAISARVTITDFESALISKADVDDIPVIVSFATDSEAAAYSAANPTAWVFSRGEPEVD